MDEPALATEAAETGRDFAPSGAPAPSAPPRPRLLWGQWVLANSAAALVAWGLAAGVGALAGPLLGPPQSDLPDWGRAALSAGAAALAGAVYGGAQWLVLRRRLPDLRWHVWVAITTTANLVSYVAGFLLSAPLLAAFSSFVFDPFKARSDPATWTVSAGQVATGMVLGVLLGWVQWLVLRHQVRRAGWWLAGVACASLAAGILAQAAWQAMFSATGTVDATLLALLNWLGSGPLTALITGGVVVYLLRPPGAREAPSPTPPSLAPTGGAGPGPADAQRAVPAPPVGAARRRGVRWAGPYLIGGNLLLGLLLWFLAFTDYSLPGTLPDLLFPPVLVVLGSAAFLAAGAAPAGPRRWLGRLAALPSLLGGLLYLLLVGVAFLPPATLGGVFFADEIASEVLVQQVPAPDGSRVAEVYYRPGGYGGATFHPLLVRVHYTLFPLVERDIVMLSVAEVGHPGQAYLTWRDNDTLEFVPTGETVPLGVIKPEVPLVVTLAAAQLERWAQVREQQRATAAQTGGVSQVPLYPGRRTSDQTSFDKEQQTQFRSYNVEDAAADAVVQWYKQTLAQAPWTLVRADRYTGSDLGASYTRDCLQAQRRDPGGPDKDVYYIEVLGNGPERTSIHVNIGTPHPITETCARFVGPP